ncbi:putative calcium-transporting atpase 7, plasma membrane-type [Fagus crenata]
MDRLLRYYCVFLIIPILVLCLRTKARPLNPNMEGKKKNQSSFMSSLAKVVPLMPSPPTPWSNNIGNNHEMSDGPSVHGEVFPLNKGPVPPSAPSPITM